MAFVYFAHTTLLSLEESLPNYEVLWQKLGSVYTFHGGLMVVGGLALVFLKSRSIINKEPSYLFVGFCLTCSLP